MSAPAPEGRPPVAPQETWAEVRWAPRVRTYLFRPCEETVPAAADGDRAAANPLPEPGDRLGRPA